MAPFRNEKKSFLNLLQKCFKQQINTLWSIECER